MESRFSSSVVLMWLVSALSAFLTSALLLEPFSICIQALYLAAVVRPVDPEVEDRLAQETEVRRTEQDLGDKVHPLSGYGLLQAKEEERKLRKLRVLMRRCLVYMLFLLVVLMVNYQEHVHEANSRRLHSAIKHMLITASPGQPSLTALSGWMNAEQWVDERLISHLYENPSLSLTGPASSFSRLLQSKHQRCVPIWSSSFDADCSCFITCQAWTAELLITQQEHCSTFNVAEDYGCIMCIQSDRGSNAWEQQ